VRRKIIELDEELKIVGNNMKSLEIAEQEVRNLLLKHTQYTRAEIINTRSSADADKPARRI